jgi:hypothetical protein
MKVRKFAKFYQISTGYISGTIPPKFDEAHKVPISACGSDSIYFFDGRLSLDSCISMARTVCKQRKLTGFTIEAGPILNCKIIRPLELIEGEIV